MNVPERLPFRLPEMVRTAWTSDEARAVWEPRFAAIAAAWQQIELATVDGSLRDCALTVVPAWRYYELLAQRRDLAVAPLHTLPEVSRYQAFATKTWQRGEKLNLRIAVGRTSAIDRLRAAFSAHDDATLGRLLGYPQCCVAFFTRACVEEAWMDPTWLAAAGTSAAAPSESLVELAGIPETNLLLRWLGVRPVPHLPCAFDCAASTALAAEYARIGRRIGFEREMAWAEEALSWSVEWSSLHGIAEIRTPVVKVAATTDAIASRLVVRLRGRCTPELAARGVVFPFVRDESRDWWFRDNGFTSRAAMDAAHEPVVSLAVRALTEDSGTILDLGCGNGVLLRRIRGRVAVRARGLDSDRGKVARVSTVAGAEGVVGDLTTDEAVWDGARYALVLLAAARLCDTPEAEVERLLARIRAHGERLLLYSYADSPAARPVAERFGLAVIDEEGGAVLCRTASSQ